MADNKQHPTVRKMVDDDLPRVNYIDNLLLGEDRVLTWPFTFETYWRIFPPKLRYVAEVDGEVVGFVVGNIAQEERSQSVLRLTYEQERHSGHRLTGWIDMIGIHPDYQHRGIGRALIEAFGEECKRNNAIMRGIAREGDEKLQRFLVGLGFKKWDVAIFEKET